MKIEKCIEKMDEIEKLFGEISKWDINPWKMTRIKELIVEVGYLLRYDIVDQGDLEDLFRAEEKFDEN